MSNIFLLESGFSRNKKEAYSVKIGHRLTVSPDTSTSAHNVCTPKVHLILKVLHRQLLENSALEISVTHPVANVRTQYRRNKLPRDGAFRCYEGGYYVVKTPVNLNKQLFHFGFLLGRA